jgi:hypothetical protein
LRRAAAIRAAPQRRSTPRGAEKGNKQMKMRTTRTAGLVGGIATGALLLAGSAAQAAPADVEESAGDLVMATPEALGGLPVSPAAVTGLAGGVTGGVTDQVPGLDALSTVPGLDAVMPAGPSAEAKADKPVDADDIVDQVNSSRNDVKDDNDRSADAGDPLGDLLSGLGGGLPVPLPF